MEKIKVTPHSLKIYDKADKELYIHYFDSLDKMLAFAAKIYCFGDCDDSMDIRTITTYGREISYVGWQPDMTFEFKYKDTGKRCWIGQFPNWEH